MWNDYTNICTYRVKDGARENFIELLKKHWPTLNKNGLATDTPAIFFEATIDEKDQHSEKGTTFVEIFCWSGPEASSLAHQMPEVMAIWETMGGLVEDRDGKPGMEFPGFRPIDPYEE